MKLKDLNVNDVPVVEIPSNLDIIESTMSVEEAFTRVDEGLELMSRLDRAASRLSVEDTDSMVKVKAELAYIAEEIGIEMEDSKEMFKKVKAGAKDAYEWLVKQLKALVEMVKEWASKAGAAITKMYGAAKAGMFKTNTNAKIAKIAPVLFTKGNPDERDVLSLLAANKLRSYKQGEVNLVNNQIDMDGRILNLIGPVVHSIAGLEFKKVKVKVKDGITPEMPECSEKLLASAKKAAESVVKFMQDFKVDPDKITKFKTSEHGYAAAMGNRLAEQNAVKEVKIVLKGQKDTLQLLALIAAPKEEKAA